MLLQTVAVTGAAPIAKSVLHDLLTRTVSVSGLLVFSVLLIFMLEALAILILARVRAGVVIHERLTAAFVYCVHPLTGSDKRLSWSKIISALIIAGYWANGTLFMPQGVAYWIIAASHGTKVLLALIDKTKLDVAATETLSYTKSVVETVFKGRDKATGEPLPGAPGQPLPPVAPPAPPVV